MSGELKVTTLRGGFIELGVDARQVVDLFRVLPGLTFFHVRDLFGQIFGSHRREWLRRKEVTFRSGGMQVGEGARFLTGSRGRSFTYQVFPESKTPEKPRLSDIHGETYTESEAAQGLELGGRFASRRSRFIPIPIGITRDALGRTKSAYVARGEGDSGVRRFARTHDTVTLPSKANPRVQVIYWKRMRNTRRGTGGKFIGPRNRAATGYDLVPAFLLVDGVIRKARLRFIDTWLDLHSDRIRRYEQMLAKLEKEAVRAG